MLHGLCIHAYICDIHMHRSSLFYLKFLGNSVEGSSLTSCESLFTCSFFFKETVKEGEAACTKRKKKKTRDCICIT